MVLLCSCGSRFDVQYRVYAATSTLSIFFTKATAGLISHTEEVAPGILSDYSDAEQLISLDLNLASVRHSHGISYTGKQPQALSWGYIPDSGQLTVFLTSEQSTAGLEQQQTEDANISIGTDSQGLWQSVILQNALVFIPSAPLTQGYYLT